MLLKLIIFILMLSSQAFADANSSLSLSSQTSPASISLNSSGGGIDSNTELMLPLNNSVIDLSQNSATVTNTNVTFSNTTPIFAGTYYGIFNGSSGYLSVPAASYLNLNSSNFTIDFWVKFVSLPSNGNAVTLLSKLDNAGNNGYQIYCYNSSGTYQIFASGYSGGSGIDSINAVTITPTIGVWYHIAWVRNGNAFNLYWNGFSIGNATGSTSIPTVSNTFNVGAWGGSPIQYYANVDISEFRVSNTARWTSNFIPPSLPYSPNPVSQIILQDTNTQEAKLWMDGSDSDKFKIDDATATRLTISGGNVGIGTTSPGFPLDVAGPVRIQTGLITNGIAPTIGSGTGDCGTTPSVTGNDISGTITVGTGTNGGQCTVTFSAAKSSTPNCICQNSTTANLTRAANQATTSFACTGTLTAGDKLVYWCPQ